MKRIYVGLYVMLAVLILGACSSGSVSEEVNPLTVTPTSGSPGAVIKVSGLELAPEDAAGLEVWVGPEFAPFTIGEDGVISAALPLFLGEGGWPSPPAEPQLVEVRRAATVLGRSAEGVTVTELPRAPGSTQEVSEALAAMIEAFDRLWSLVPTELAEEAPLRDAALSMLRGLVSEGVNSLQAVLDGTAPLLAGSEPDLALIDALLASSGAGKRKQGFSR
jgi:hypothetical protein